MEQPVRRRSALLVAILVAALAVAGLAMFGPEDAERSSTPSSGESSSREPLRVEVRRVDVAMGVDVTTPQVTVRSGSPFAYLFVATDREDLDEALVVVAGEDDQDRTINAVGAAGARSLTSYGDGVVVVHARYDEAGDWALLSSFVGPE